MSQETETTLRKSLDAVDRHRKRALAAIIVVVILTAAAQFLLDQLSRTGELSRLLVAAVVVLELWTATWAVAIVFGLTRMTKMILRAIELASRPPA